MSRNVDYLCDCCGQYLGAQRQSQMTTCKCSECGKLANVFTCGECDFDNTEWRCLDCWFTGNIDWIQKAVAERSIGNAKRGTDYYSQSAFDSAYGGIQ